MISLPLIWKSPGRRSLGKNSRGWISIQGSIEGTVYINKQIERKTKSLYDPEFQPPGKNKDKIKPEIRARKLIIFYSKKWIDLAHLRDLGCVTRAMNLSIGFPQAFHGDRNGTVRALDCGSFRRCQMVFFLVSLYDVASLFHENEDIPVFPLVYCFNNSLGFSS